MVDRAWVASALSEGPRFSTLIVAGKHHLDALVFEDLLSQADRQGLIVLVAEQAEDASPSWSAAVDMRDRVRWRVTTRSRVDVCDGTTRWWSDGMQVARRDVRPHAEMWPPLTVLSPQSLGRFEFDEPAPVTHLERDCVSVVGRQIPAARTRPDEFGDAVRLLLDVATGLIVRWQSWYQGRDLSDMSIHHLVIDGPIDDEEFRVKIPDGVTVEELPPEELRRVQNRTRTGDAPPIGSDAIGVLEDYVPRSDPPTDQRGAEEQIRQIVAGLNELSDDERDAVNVQGGVGLGVAFVAARERFRDRLHAPIRHRVAALRFLAEDEAVVLIELQGAPVPVSIEGRVVHQDGRWLVERRTATSLLRRAGVAIPPPPR